MKLRQRLGRLAPNGRPLLCAYTRDASVVKDAAVEKFHNVERGANDRSILTHDVWLGDRDIGIFQSSEDLIFALYAVRVLRDLLSGRALAQDKSLAVRGGDLICWV